MYVIISLIHYDVLPLYNMRIFLSILYKIFYKIFTKIYTMKNYNILIIYNNIKYILKLMSHILIKYILYYCFHCDIYAIGSVNS